MIAYILLTILPVALLQTTLDVRGAGALPDGSSASGLGLAVGGDVQGTVGVSVDQSASRSSVVLSASGSTPSSLRIETVLPQSPKATYKKTPVPVQKKSYVKPQAKCEHLKDDKCYDIHYYEKCGYCILSKYPTKGYGCSYTEEVVLKKKGDSKKEYVYETKIVPKCDCEGVYILDHYACPSCDSLLKEILTCAGATSNTGEIQVPASCLEKVGVSVQELIKCGFVTQSKPETTGVKKEKEAVKVSPKAIIVEKAAVKPSPKVAIVKKDDPKVLVVSKPQSTSKNSIATATATATTSVASTKHH
eukprot:TRINITY_DN4531_c1_g1_i6.p2 TRINITY_DN4531_c1_g1~~TRINITY_DN4531_c1_g1_i6.p2  ORF type:complete len:304 (-),score=30.34 TRINITY_DN4531_c1_g1_i6:233-1144(-)